MSHTPFPAEAYKFLQLNATTTVKRDPGVLGGIFVSSASGSPTITIYDNTAASGTKIVAQFTPAEATAYPVPARFNNGLHVVIGGTVECTVFYV